ncbi:hypothetical protein JTE90_008187 [Oedothorax gibbosus]|uniref:Uncharacterized protein n=1 Tax=Oedothorax gibbosus TaxID=931172 RepID=A0AAV6VDZ7_9ARAC|nr:hypothetical protein JTE90_008187 [Oedothorax gibbosus]
MTYSLPPPNFPVKSNPPPPLSNIDRPRSLSNWKSALSFFAQGRGPLIEGNEELCLLPPCDHSFFTSAEDVAEMSTGTKG